MVGEESFSRRTGGMTSLSVGGPNRAAARPARPANAVTPQTLDIVRYIADMTAQLESMAISGHFDMLAYFLGMAKAESELLVRTSPGEDVSLPEAVPKDGERLDQPQDEFRHGNSFE
jgi:hypothetical protein